MWANNIGVQPNLRNQERFLWENIIYDEACEWVGTSLVKRRKKSKQAKQNTVCEVFELKKSSWVFEGQKGQGDGSVEAGRDWEFNQSGW